MTGNSKIGRNIRSLRLAFGETQQYLADVIGFDRKTITKYENNSSVNINNEVLLSIADHYMISIEQLMTDDLSWLENIHLNFGAYEDKLTTYYPIVSLNSSQKDVNFSEGFILHKRIIDAVVSGEYASLNSDLLIKCYNDYNVAFGNGIVKGEAAANMLSLYCMAFGGFHVGAHILNSSAKDLKQLKENPKFLSVVKDFDAWDKNDSDYQAFVTFHKSKKAKHDIALYLRTLRSSSNTSLADLGYFYIAQIYFLGLVDNGHDMYFNMEIGIEMHESFANMGNIYSANMINTR